MARWAVEVQVLSSACPGSRLAGRLSASLRRVSGRHRSRVPPDASAGWTDLAWVTILVLLKECHYVQASAQLLLDSGPGDSPPSRRLWRRVRERCIPRIVDRRFGRDPEHNHERSEHDDARPDGGPCCCALEDAMGDQDPGADAPRRINSEIPRPSFFAFAAIFLLSRAVVCTTILSTALGTTPSGRCQAAVRWR